MPNKIFAAFYNRSNYDYNFINKELVNKFERQFECLGKNTEKYKTFSVLIEKEIRKNDKDGNEDITTISWKIKVIDSARFMASSLLNLVDNIAEGIHKSKCQDCDYFLDYESVKDNLIKYERLYCNKDYLNKIDEKLKKAIQKYL